MHGILNVNLLSVHVYKGHTAAVTAKALDVLCLLWKDSIIGVSTDGERKITGRISGVRTRFQNVANPGFISIWCGACQLDIVLLSAYIKLGEKSF